MNALTKNTIIRGFVRSFPKLVSLETAQSLIRDNHISVETATDIVAIVESNDGGIDPKNKTESIVPAVSVADFKLSAALEILKEDDRSTYDEFLRVDEARASMVAKVNAKYNNDVNLVIGVLKTAPGANIKEIDEILASPVVADRAGFGFSTNVNTSAVKV